LNYGTIFAGVMVLAVVGLGGIVVTQFSTYRDSPYRTPAVAIQGTIRPRPAMSAAPEVKPADTARGDASDVLAQPSSSWMTFASSEPANGIITYHARLWADAPASSSTMPDLAPHSSLELQAAPQREGHVLITLVAIPASACAAIASIEAKGDILPPQHFAASPQAVGHNCKIDVADYRRFRDMVLNAQTLAVRPLPMAAPFPVTSWHVAGLNWQVITP
jgi:hypothetical protein